MNPSPRRAGAPAPERIQKILARAGLASRREAEEWIRAGRVSINGEPAALGSKASGADQIRLDGRLIRQASPTRVATFLCHRSPGEALVEPREEEERDALQSRLPKRSGKRFIAISPMPRMDGGLELLSSDGETAERLQRGVRRLEIEFSMRVRGELTPQQKDGILAGELDAGQIEVISVEPGGGEGSNRWYQLITRGATGRDVRQLFERQAAPVSRILRVRMGPLTLDRHMPRGRARPLEIQELADLLGATTGSPGSAP